MHSNKDWNKLDGVKITKFPTSFVDDRGKYNEVFNLKSDYNYKFKQLSVVHNQKNIIRGMHGDWGTTKKITVISGQVIQVLLDCRIESKTFGQFKSSILTKSDELLITIPPGIANGFQVLSEPSVYMYLQDSYYKDFKQFTITPFDKKICDAFDFSLQPEVSNRDKDRSQSFENYLNNL